MDNLFNNNLSADERRKQYMQLVQKQQSGGGGNLLTSFLPTIGGIIGGIGGSFVAPGLGTAAGGAGGSALGKSIANLIEGKDATEGVGTEALFGALPGAGGLLRGAKAMATGGRTAQVANEAKPGLLSKFGSFLENKGGDLAASQANLTRAQARTLGQPLNETFGSLQRRTGTAKMDDLAKIADSVTGGGGSVTLGINKAVSPVGVDIGDLSRVANKSLGDNAPAVFGASRKSLEENVKNSVVKAYGGDGGTLSSVVGGKTALDTSKGFATQAAQYRDAFKRSGNVADQQTAKVYEDLAQTINDRLYRAPGSVDNFLQVGKPQILADFRAAAKDAVRTGDKVAAKAYLKLADDFQKSVTNIKDARTFQRDFVELGKINEKTLEASKGAAMQMGDNLQGAGKILQRPTNIVALPLEAATPKISSVMMDVGRKLQGTGANGATGNVTRRELMKQLIGQGVPRAILGQYTPASAGSLDENVDPAMIEAMAADAAPMDAEAAAKAAAGMGGDGRPPKENIDEAVMIAALSGDKETFNMMKSLSEYFYPSSGDKTSAATQKGLVSLGQAENLLNTFEQQLNEAGGQDNGVLARIVGGARTAAGQVGLDAQASAYNAARQGTVASLAKALGDSGTLTDQDISRAMALIPDLGKSNEERAMMFSQLRALINNNRNTLTAASGGRGSLEAVFGG